MTGVSEPGLIFHSALRSPERPTWEGALWVGEVWLDVLVAANCPSESVHRPLRCRLEGGQGYRRARLLVRDGDHPLGFVEVAVTDAEVDFGELLTKVAGLSHIVGDRGASPVRANGARWRDADVSVVLCTRDRVELLGAAIESILAVDYPDFEVIVVDNAPRTAATRNYVLALEHPRIHLVTEPRPGLSRARNAGLLAASGSIVAFTDDDVVVDRRWLRTLVDGFELGRSVSCVSGMVPAGEIRTPAQAYFDRRVGWSVTTEPRIFDLSNPPGDVPLFPFAVGRFGTGANFAIRRDVVLGLGGFDEALGAGAPTDGGEDLDMFFRILYSGRQLVHEPAAIVWHRHRSENEGLVVQARGYGLGLGAWLGKIAADPVVARLAFGTAVRRLPAVLRHLRKMSKDASPPANLASMLPTGIWTATVKSIVKGPLVYHLARRSGRSAAPLRGASRP